MLVSKVRTWLVSKVTHWVRFQDEIWAPFSIKTRSCAQGKMFLSSCETCTDRNFSVKYTYQLVPSVRSGYVIEERVIPNEGCGTYIQGEPLTTLPTRGLSLGSRVSGSPTFQGEAKAYFLR